MENGCEELAFLRFDVCFQFAGCVHVMWFCSQLFLLDRLGSDAPNESIYIDLSETVLSDRQFDSAFDSIRV